MSNYASAGECPVNTRKGCSCAATKSQTARTSTSNRDMFSKESAQSRSGRREQCNKAQVKPISHVEEEGQDSEVGMSRAAGGFALGGEGSRPTSSDNRGGGTMYRRREVDVEGMRASREDAERDLER